jgi:KipI family sensor histidine kinase inhibitor
VTVRWRMAGDRAVLAELDDLRQVIRLHQRLASGRPTGVVDVIPAARTVLVAFDPGLVSPEVVSEWIGGTVDLPGTTAEPAAVGAAAPGGAVVELPVHYAGEDLAEVCALLDCTEPELVALHTGTEFTVAFCGFAPGFAYLTGLPSGLRVPRRRSPRTTVPAGSVALADEFSGVYPRESPGGWQLIGRTDTVVFDLDRDPPTLLPPGTRVRFVQVSP